MKFFLSWKKIGNFGNILNDVFRCFKTVFMDKEHPLKKAPLITAISLGLLAEAILFATPFISKFLVDIVILKNNGQLLLPTFGASVLLLLMMSVTSLFSNFLFFRIFINVGISFKTFFFKILQNSQLSFFKNITKGDITFRMLNDTEKLINFCSGLVATLATQMVILPIIIFIAIWNWQLTCFILGVLVIQAIVISLFQESLFNVANLQKEKSQNVTRFVVENFSRIEMVRAFNMGENESRKFEKTLKEQFEVAFRSFKLQKYAEISTILVNNFWVFLVLAYGGSLVLHGKITLGTLLAFLLLANNLNRPLMMIVGLFLSFQDVRSSLDRVADYINQGLLKSTPILAQNSSATIEKGLIEIRNCSFGYGESDLAIKNITLAIPNKSFFAIVGANGSGKSTICKLIVRFYELTDGEIFIDGKDNRTLSIDELRSAVLLSLQNQHVFTGTIWDNVTYGCKVTPSKKEVLLSLAKAKADFISTLPKGLDTIISSDVFNVSGGEIQRIALARAFLLKPKIFIFDEPSSSLDPLAREQLNSALRDLQVQSTVILVSHNLQNIINADQVAVIENGYLLETGNPKILMNQSDSNLRRLFANGAQLA